MSRIATSDASFSSQRAAMRRACSSEFRSVSFLGSVADAAGKCTRASRMSPSAIEAEARDLGDDGVRHETGERAPVGGAGPQLGRGDVDGRNREELDALRSGEPGDDLPEHALVDPRPGGNAEACEL